MGKWDRVLDRVLRGTSDASIPFEDLCGLLQHLGFERRTRGSHNVFRRHGVVERPNLQRSGKHAKAYQVKQVRAIILKHGMADEI